MTARVWPVDAVTGAPSYTGRSLRQTQVATALAGATAARPLGGMSGVRPGTSTSIATATSTTWTVTPFGGSIDGEALAIAGPYLYAFDANVTGSVTAAAGSARVDRLDVQVSDPAESDGSSVPSIAVVYNAGVPGTGVPVAAPARSHPLALINVPLSGGGSPTVTWNAPNTVAAGGVLPTANSTFYPTSPYVGQFVDDAILGLLRWNGTAWTGLDQVVPTGVAGTGVTQVGGLISLSAASAISLLGVASGSSDEIEITFIGTATAAANVQLRVRASGSDIATATYNWIYIASDLSSGPSRTPLSGDTAITVARVDAGRNVFRIRVTDLFAASATMVEAYSNDAITTRRDTTGRNTNATSYTDVSIIIGAGTVTGKMRVRRTFAS